ncbi:hypothetical protein GGX14DRAFT_697434 [Mycena pura]|uniref:AAA+ ATPase domain-containing protein n=1 Tax=Mycena pura TaxID=153505 RepID=A0AAD6YBA3_9AGAR|nr:hypothetical protein GGX14DRAFT_697434 [Mycena pura]
MKKAEPTLDSKRKEVEEDHMPSVDRDEEDGPDDSDISPATVIADVIHRRKGRVARKEEGGLRSTAVAESMEAEAEDESESDAEETNRRSTRLRKPNRRYLGWLTHNDSDDAHKSLLLSSPSLRASVTNNASPHSHVHSASHNQPRLCLATPLDAPFARRTRLRPPAGDASQVAELLRFIFLGTIVETGRQMAAKIAEFAADCESVLSSAKISRAQLLACSLRCQGRVSDGRFRVRLIVHYLEHHRVWNESRSFKVVARNAASRPAHSVKKSSSFFRWRGYWMSISKGAAGLTHYDTDSAGAGERAEVALVIALSPARADDIVANHGFTREFYVTSAALPRKQIDVKREPYSGSLLTAYFEQSDLAHDWMLEYLRFSDALINVMDYHISMKQSHRGWGTDPGDLVRYMPAPDSMQRFLFESPRTGRSTWIQGRDYPHWCPELGLHPEVRRVDHLTFVPTSALRLRAFTNLFARLHSSDKQVLADLIECAEAAIRGGRRIQKRPLGQDRHQVPPRAVHPHPALRHQGSDSGGRTRVLDNEEWYKMTGIPHRRGYLLHGAPGTGKSSTVHAIAGELGLEIYFISLANPGIDDYTLAQLIGDTPARCILLIESVRPTAAATRRTGRSQLITRDIDCAFRHATISTTMTTTSTRRNDHYRRAVVTAPPKSAVTLSGLLNVLDSVSSEEGRITFATTNHIANLDAALIRPGRMDVKIKYGLATTEQIEQVFKVFFPAVAAQDTDTAALARHAAAFAAAIPTETYSIAQIQGYLLTKKHDPAGALQGARAWLVAQQEERRALLDAKQQRRAEIARWQRGVDEAYMRGVDAWERVVGEGEAPQAPPTPATSAGSPVDRGAPRDLLVMGEGEAPREPATGSGSPVDRGAPRDIVDLLMWARERPTRACRGPGSPVDGGAPGDIVTSDLLVQQQGNVDSAE